jgi:hypothetical protein
MTQQHAPVLTPDVMFQLLLELAPDDLYLNLERISRAIEQATLAAVYAKSKPVAWMEETPLGETFLAYGLNPKATTTPLYALKEALK